jgi:alkylation response protein AidB-like acyl-CoA dehydrogenase
VDLRYSESETRLAGDLRDWLAEALPKLPPAPAHDDWPARRAYDTAWQRMLYDAGYAGIAWPRRYGGREASPTEQLVFLETMFDVGAPNVGVNFVGLLHAGPTIMIEGTDEQRERFLPPILRGEQVWCQGFSEPNAGSDLAGLQTRAVRDGDEYVVTGQKIWSSYAQIADVGELLVRTDPDAPKHKGISWLVVPMDSPGIEIRPIHTLLGTSEFSEVFYDDVRVPLANRVGAENDGWRVAMTTLGFERGTAFVGELLEARRLAGLVAAAAREVRRSTGTAWDDAVIRREAGRLLAEFDALWALTKWNVTEAGQTGVPGPGGSVLKLRLCEAAQDLATLAMRVLDRAGTALGDIVPGGGHIVFERLRSLGLTIGGGTSQIQRNLIADRVLGLPRE